MDSWYPLVRERDYRPGRIAGDSVSLFRRMHKLKLRNCLFLDISRVALPQDGSRWQKWWVTLMAGRVSHCGFAPG